MRLLVALHNCAAAPEIDAALVDAVDWVRRKTPGETWALTGLAECRHDQRKRVFGAREHELSLQPQHAIAEA